MRCPTDSPVAAVLVPAAAFFTISCADTSIMEPGLTTGTEVTAPSFNRAGAGPPRTGTGTWRLTKITVISTREVGNNVIIDNEVELAWEGTLVGTSTHPNRLVVHRATGTVTFQNKGEFTGNVEGCDGVESFTYKTAAKGEAGIAQGTTTIVASKATTGVVLSGVIRWSLVGDGGPYEIEYIC